MSESDVSIPDNSIEEQVQLFEPKVSIPDNSIEDVTHDMPIALRKGKQSYVKYPISQFVCTDHLSIQHQSFIISIDTIKTPILVQEALKDENWVQAMKEEMEALENNSTWEIVDKPKDKRDVGCRWIYTLNYKSDGILEQYKVRLIAKGYTQTYGIDYEETFSLVAKMNTELGKLKYFLGIEVAYSKQGIFISKRKYVLDLFKETRKMGCKISRAPIEQNHKIGERRGQS
ncbi:putative mitochondrial protein, partial [Mucuna pruriens]